MCVRDTTDNFISNKLLKRHKIEKLQLKTPRTIWNIDGTHNKAGTMTESVNLLVWVRDRRHEMCFLIMDLGEDKIDLGVMEQWVNTYNTVITNISK